MQGDAARAGYPARLSVGVLLPQEEGPGDPPPSWALIADAARAAEDAGLDSVWLVDHLLWASDPWERDPAAFGELAKPGGLGALEAWTTIAGLAAVTTRVRLGTIVTCARYRQPALLAKMADSVDDISGGRLILGLGAGDNRPEHTAFGYPIDRPVSHFEEALAIIVPLLRLGHVEFEGEHYRAHTELRPRAARAGGPPILIGSLTNRPRVLGLVAQYADVWNGWIWATTTAHQVPAIREGVDAACLGVGRDPASLARSLVLVVALDGPMAEQRDVITGSMDEIAARIAAFAAEGIDEVQVRLFPNDLPAIERFGRIIEMVHAIEAATGSRAKDAERSA